MTLGSIFYNRRKELSMTQAFIAQSIGGITNQAVRNWEMDISIPTDEHLIQICQVMQLDSDILHPMVVNARLKIRAEIDRKANDPLPLCFQQIRDLFKQR